MKKIIQQNKIFFSCYLLFLILGGIALSVIHQGDEILFFSSLHTRTFDWVFKYVSVLAEVPLLVLILIIALRFSYGKGIILALNILLIFSVTAFLKHIIFSSQVRPSVFFEGKAQLNFIQGVEILRYHSFPSGHSSAVFGFFCMLSLLVKNKNLSALFFLLALAVGVSRIYLLQHFLRDVYVGSIVGVSISVIFYLTFVRSGFYNNLHWKDKALWK